MGQTMSRKNVHAVELGRKGGKVGGLSRSAAKVAASRRNAEKARRAKKLLATGESAPSLHRKVQLPDGRMVSRQYRYQLQNQSKERARAELQREVRIGRIKRQPCQECGVEPAEAHHPNYDKPREVIWLCSKHHGMAHRKSL